MLSYVRKNMRALVPLVVASLLAVGCAQRQNPAVQPAGYSGYNYGPPGQGYQPPNNQPAPQNPNSQPPAQQQPGFPFPFPLPIPQPNNSPNGQANPGLPFPFPNWNPWAQPQTTSNVTVYAASWCAACQDLQAQLGQRKIPFTVIDVEQRPDAFERAKSASGSGNSIPLTDVSKNGRTNWVKGDDADSVERFYRGGL